MIEILEIAQVLLIVSLLTEQERPPIQIADQINLLFPGSALSPKEVWIAVPQIDRLQVSAALIKTSGLNPGLQTGARRGGQHLKCVVLKWGVQLKAAEAHR
jgi:hypothetical protein